MCAINFSVRLVLTLSELLANIGSVIVLSKIHPWMHQRQWLKLELYFEYEEMLQLKTTIEEVNKCASNLGKYRVVE